MTAPTPKGIEEWEKEYEKLIFSLNRDEERGNGTNPYISLKKQAQIKAFIEETISSVSSARDEEWRERIRGMRLEQTRNETDNDWFFGSGYNRALDDLLTSIEDKK